MSQRPAASAGACSEMQLPLFTIAETMQDAEVVPSLGVSKVAEQDADPDPNSK